jgi:chromatin remodeling complex protein RSC6
VDDQVWQGNGLNVDAFDFSAAVEASYRVKIEGRLLHDIEQNQDANDTKPDEGTTADGDKMDEDSPGNDNVKKPTLSHFFKAMSVDFDKSRFRNGAEQSVEWKKPESAVRNQGVPNLPPGSEFDEITFKRNGDENTNITINLFRQENPERYQLSPELAEVVDMKEATQQEAVMALWEYIRLAGLQEDEEKRNFRCDELMKKVRLLQTLGNKSPCKVFFCGR